MRFAVTPAWVATVSRLSMSFSMLKMFDRVLLSWKSRLTRILGFFSGSLMTTWKSPRISTGAFRATVNLASLNCWVSDRVMAVPGVGWSSLRLRKVPTETLVIPLAVRYLVTCLTASLRPLSMFSSAAAGRGPAAAAQRQSPRIRGRTP